MNQHLQLAGTIARHREADSVIRCINRVDEISQRCRAVIRIGPSVVVGALNILSAEFHFTRAVLGRTAAGTQA